MTTPASGPRSRASIEDDVNDHLSRTMDSSAADAANETGDGMVPLTEGRAAGTRSPYVKSTGRAPSPPWYGSIIIIGLGLMATILLTYTLLDWQWQQDLGWWNYVITLALIPIISVFMRLWQPDENL